MHERIHTCGHRDTSAYVSVCVRVCVYACMCVCGIPMSTGLCDGIFRGQCAMQQSEYSLVPRQLNSLSVSTVLSNERTHFPDVEIE